jgi:uncharacterized protein
MLLLTGGLIIGLALGLTGGGGSLLALPLLILVYGYSPSQAAQTSLVVVTLTALAGVVLRWKSGTPDVRIVAVYGIAGMFAAPFGVSWAARMDESLLLGAFTALMIGVAWRMYRTAQKDPASTHTVRAQIQSPGNHAYMRCEVSPKTKKLRFNGRCLTSIVTVGLATGLLSGLFGVGGGFIIVPSLVFFTTTSLQQAVSNSLFIIFLISAAGSVQVVMQKSLELGPVLLLSVGGVAGLLLALLIAKRVSGPQLQKTFAVAVIILALVNILGV